jgi:Spy/CpxP family protein refolding chaperone
VALRPEQRAEIEKLAADAQARHEAGAEARKAAMLALAAQIERGSLDRAALQPKVDAIAAAWDRSRAADRAAIERLHAILDSDQRSDLVDAIEDGIRDRMQEHAWHAPIVEKWAKDLGLTDDQKDQIRSALKTRFADQRGGAWREGARKGKRALEAFKEDHFVLDEVAPPEDARAKAGEISGKVLGVVESVLPILTPAQRKIAADKLRARAAAGEDMTP